MKKLALLLLFVAVGAWGQTAGNVTTTEGATTISIGTSALANNWNPMAGVPFKKECAFGLTAKWQYGEAKTKPPTTKEIFDSEMQSGIGWESAIAHYHQVCPYERAIELFGQDRVEYRDQRVFNDVPDCDEGGEFVDPKTHKCGRIAKQILVDGEVVYEEKP